MSLSVSNTKMLSSEEFNDLILLEDWFKYTWGDEHDPSEEVIEYEEDYELENVNQPKELLSTKIQ